MASYDGGRNQYGWTLTVSLFLSGQVQTQILFFKLGKRDNTEIASIWIVTV